MESAQDLEVQKNCYTAEDCRFIITANPGNERLLASLGRDPQNLHIDELYSMYKTWDGNNRFIPPHLRNDNMEYYEFMSSKFNSIINLIRHCSEDLEINELLQWIGELKPIAVNIDAGVPLHIEDHTDRSDYLKAISKKSLNNGGWLTYIKDPKRNDIYFEEDSVDKFAVTWIKDLVFVLTGKNHESYTQNMQFLNSTLHGQQSYIQPLQVLFENSVRDYGDLVSSIELLYNLININPWAYENNPGTDFRIGPSAGSMMIFNSILIKIGYNPIPIYAIDFAAYSLDQEGFTAYILYIMNKVEGQEIKHELPTCLFEVLNRNSEI